MEEGNNLNEPITYNILNESNNEIDEDENTRNYNKFRFN